MNQRKQKNIDKKNKKYRNKNRISRKKMKMHKMKFCRCKNKEEMIVKNSEKIQKKQIDNINKN